MWLYAAIDVETNVVLHAQRSCHRVRAPAEAFLNELKEKLRVGNAVFLVGGMGYLTALAWTDLTGERNYTDRNIVEKLFQTYTMRIERFHEIWNGSQASAERWLTTPPTTITIAVTKHSTINRQLKHSNRGVQSSSAVVTDTTATTDTADI